MTLRDRIERRTGWLFGVEKTGSVILANPRFYLRLGRRGDGYVLLEFGNGRRFFYLTRRDDR